MKTLSIIATIAIFAAMYVMATTEKTLLSLSLFAFAFCFIGVIAAKIEKKTNSFYRNIKVLNKNTGLISARDI